MSVLGGPWRLGTRDAKTSTAWTEGYVLCFDTDGFAHATQTLKSTSPTYSFVVAYQDHAATDSVSDRKIIEGGIVELPKVSGAIEKGQLVMISTTPGKVTAFSAPNIPTAFTESGLQAEIDKFLYIVGACEVAVASGAATVLVRLRQPENN